jgi:DNA-binding MarR family transcriptional regulator
MVSRAQVLVALRHCNDAVTPARLADWIDAPSHQVAQTLKQLYYMDQVRRLPHPAFKGRFLYRTKELHREHPHLFV